MKKNWFSIYTQLPMLIDYRICESSSSRHDPKRPHQIDIFKLVKILFKSI